MGGFTDTLGLLFEISADPSKVDAGMAQLNAATSESASGMTQLAAASDAASQQMMDGNEKVGQSFRRNFEELHNLHTLMRATMVPLAIIEFTGQWENLHKQIAAAAMELGGYSKTLVKEFADAVKQSEQALTHFATVGMGEALLHQTNARIAQLEEWKVVLDKVNASTSGHVHLTQQERDEWGKLRAAGMSLGDIEDELAKLEATRNLQIEQQGKLEKELGKERDKDTEAAARAAEAWRKHIEEVERGHQILPQFIVDLQNLDKAADNKATMDAAKNYLALGASVNALHFAMPALTGDISKLTGGMKALPPPVFEVSYALQRMRDTAHSNVVEMLTNELPARQRIEVSYQRQIDAATREINKLREEAAQHKITRGEMEADEAAYTQIMVDLAKAREKAKQQEARAELDSMASSLIGVAGLIVGRKAQAAIEGAYYLAEGAYDVASSIWPFNPAQLAKGLGEIAAGGQMLEVAGQGGSSSGGAALASSGIVAAASGSAPALASASRAAQPQTTTVIQLNMPAGRMVFTRSEVAAIFQMLNGALQNGSQKLVVMQPPVLRS